MPFELKREQYIPLDLNQTFSFFSDARNLEELTPSWLKFEVLTPEPIDVKAGTLIDYKLRLKGIPIRWQSEIVAWEPPHRFVDVQRRGPYKLWHHTHGFEELGGGTLVTDVVRYDVEGGPAAPFIERFFVRPDVERIFDYRARRLNGWATEQLKLSAASGS